MSPEIKRAIELHVAQSLQRIIVMLPQYTDECWESEPDHAKCDVDYAKSLLEEAARSLDDLWKDDGK